MAKTTAPPRPLSDHTQPVTQTLMGKVTPKAPAKPGTTTKTVLGAK